MADGTKLGVWAPYKDLLATIVAVVHHKKFERHPDLQSAFLQYRPAFIALLQNPPRNAKQREEVKKAENEGLRLEGHSGLVKLTRELIQDVLRLSDALELNEFSCVELLFAAEQQLPNFPGLTVRDIALLLYHDGRRCLLTALKILIDAQSGLSWTYEVDESTSELIDDLIKKLLEDGLLDKILQLLQSIIIEKEIAKLEASQLIGNNKHKKQLTELIAEERLLLADCLCRWACQQPFGVKTCISVINHLKGSTTNTSDGTLDKVLFRILMSLLVSLSTERLDLLSEATTEKDKSLPVLQDTTFISELHKTISRPDGQVWQSPGLKCVIQLSWAVFLRSCSQLHELATYTDEEIFEEDEGMLDAAVESGAFQVLREAVAGSKCFTDEAFFVKTIHTLVSGFIVKFPLKTKELRNIGDESARIMESHALEGYDPPQGLRHDFQELMLLIAKVYEKDVGDMKLSLEFWCPPEPMGSVFTPKPISAHLQNISQRQVMLNKFIRLAGDLLLQPMYVAYIKMLTSLASNPQSAQYCFNLLSTNGSVAHGRACSVSWDHFFNSFKQYYASLRLDLQSQDHVTHLHNHLTISPEELGGLTAVLLLVKTVAEQNASVRIAMCENQSWLAVASLFGLLSCSISVELKAVILDTLAAFALSPEIASGIWQSLEAAQILPTIKQEPGVTTEGGIKAELNDIESRNEVYVETRAFLRLINHLTDLSVPSTLGAGYRVPGFGPYLDFCMDTVFLRLKGRAYQDELDMWKMASECLQIFVKILSNYDPLPEHLDEHQVEIQGVSFGKAAKPPGLQILINLLNDTPLFRLVLSFIDELCGRLEENSFIEGYEEQLEVYQKTCHLSLELIESAIVRQDAFFEILRHQGASLLASPLDQLLLGVNPRSGNADYLNRIIRLMVVRDITPDIPAIILPILLHVCKSPVIQKEIVGILSSDKMTALEFLVGFADLLEVDEVEVQEKANPLEEDPGLAESQKRNFIRHKILDLLLTTLNHPSPNLAQFLLGFDTHRVVGRTVLQDFGVGGFPKTCFHSILGLLNEGLETIAGPVCVNDTPKLAEQMYQLIYMLCAHHETGEPTRRYLRLNYDFFVSHSRQLPFKIHPSDDAEREAAVRLKLANQQSWLLKAVAIEIKLTSENRLRSNLDRLVSTFFNIRESDVTAKDSLPKEASFTQRTGVNFTNRSLNATSFLTADVDVSSLSLASTLLSSLEFKQSLPSGVSLRMFDQNALDQAIDAHREKVDDNGPALCNVKSLHKFLSKEINNAMATGATVPRAELLMEVKSILAHVVECNFITSSMKAKRDGFESWRQVVETTFAVCPSDVLPIDNKQSITLELIQQLLQKISVDDAIPELAAPAASTILALMSHLCSSVSRLSGTSFGLSMTPLVAIFQSMIDCIVKSGGTQVRLRASLYGAIIYYLQMGRKESSTLEEGVAGTGGVGGSIFGPRMRESWDSNALSVLSRSGSTFMEIVCRDACDGSDITKMLALGVLDRILSIDWQQKWLSFLTSSGCLRHMVSRLVTEDNELTEMLNQSSFRIGALYAFESKMTFFSRIAQNSVGALALLQYGLCSQLAACHFLETRPSRDDIASLRYSQSYLENVHDPLTLPATEQYHTLFTAVSKLIRSVVSSLGSSHNEAITEVQHVLLAHDELFITILQDRCITPSWVSLQELLHTTSIVALFGVPKKVDDTGTCNRIRRFRSRIQRLILQLFRKYCGNEYCERVKAKLFEELGKEVSSNTTLPYHVDMLKIEACLAEIRLNLLMYIRNVVAVSGRSGPYCDIIFAPTFDEARNKELTRVVSQMPPLGLLVTELKASVDTMASVIDAKSALVRKAQNVNELSPEEIREILAQTPLANSDRFPVSERLEVLVRVLEEAVEIRDQQINILTQILENALYVLWRHIDFYYQHCVPVEDNRLPDNLPSTSFIPARRLQDPVDQKVTSSSISPEHQNLSGFTGTVTKEELQQLRQEATAHVTDQLVRKITGMEKTTGNTLVRFGFIVKMIRRILGLVKSSRG